MRQLIRTYAITGLHEITVTGYTFSKQDVRLILNETKASSATTTEELVASVLVASTKKDNIVSVVNGVITLASTTAALTVGDELTIEIDIDNIAKESNATANKNAIINAINNIDLSTVAKESAATANKEAIIAAINSAEPDLSSVAKETSVKDGNDTTIGMLKDQTNGLAAIKSAIPTVQLVLNGLATSTDLGTVLTRMGQAPVGSSKSTLFAYLSSIWNSMEGQQQEELPEGLADRVALLLQFFGIAGTFEAEAVGGETTDNPVIDECKTRYAEVFGDLLPSDFVIPNSVTIDGTTYSGTVS